ncbi:hypothetical protein ACJMK2_020625, partial [Sinanodonta woodiana]
MRKVSAGESKDKKLENEKIFQDVTYYIVGDISNEVIEMLNKGGAKRDTYLSEMVSHVIADDITHDEYQEARELFELPVVMSEWVILSTKCRKALPKELFAPEGRLFSGVVACPSQLEEDDWKRLWGMIVMNGGQCRSKLDRTCTHLIISVTQGSKYEVAMKHKDKIKIVTPDWILDSIEKREKQDETIYHPRLVFIPKPPSPPKPEPESMEVSSPATVEMQHLQLPSSTTERRPSTDSNKSGGSRPDTPSAKEALARMVTNRIYVQKGPNSHSPKSPVTPQFPGIPPNLQQMSPVPQGIGPGFPPQELPKPIQGQQPSTSGRSTLRNITNTEPGHQKSSAKPGSNKKMNQLLGIQGQAPRQPPPPYNSPQIGSTVPPTPQQPEAPAPHVYCGHDQSDNVPPDMCLFGCVFYITDYQKIVGPEQIAIWKQVIEQYGGQVDQSYSNRVTHLLCANQHSDVFQL